MDPEVSHSRNYLTDGKLGANPASSSSPAQANYIKAKDALDAAKQNLGYATDPMQESQMRKELQMAQLAYDAAKEEFAKSKLKEENLITEEQAAGLEPVTPQNGRNYEGVGKKAQNPEKLGERDQLPDISNLNQLALQQGPQKVGEQELVPGRANQAGYRAANTVTGAVKGFAGDTVNSAATAAAGLSALGKKLGGDTGEYAGWATDEVSRAAIPLEQDSKKYEQQMKEATDMQAVSDRLAQSSAEDIAQAKQGLNGLGQVAVDVGANTIQMIGDGLAAVLTGGAINPLASMFARSSGGAARQARNEDATIAQQVAYGVVRGGIEVATEKMFDGLAIKYGKGLADDMVEDIIGRMTTDKVGRSALRLLFSGLGEAAEEGVSAFTDHFTDAIYKGIQSIPESFTKEHAAESLYSMIVGFAMGFAGGGTQVITGENAEKNAKLDRAAQATEQNTQQQNVNPTVQETNPIALRARSYEGVGQKAQNPERAARIAEEAAAQPIMEPVAQTAPDTAQEVAQEVAPEPAQAPTTTRTELDPQRRQLINICNSNIINFARSAGIDLTEYYDATRGLNAFHLSQEDVRVVAQALEPIVTQLEQSGDSRPRANLNAMLTNAGLSETTSPSETAPEQPVSAPAAESATIPETPQASQQAPSEELNSQPTDEPAPEPIRTQKETRNTSTGTETGTGTGTGTGTQTETENREGWVQPRPPQEPTGESTGQSYEELGQEFGTIEPGEKPVRDSNTPQRTEKGNHVSQVVRTAIEAGATPESRLADIQAAVADGKFSFVTISNADRAANAEAKLKSNGWQKTFREWTAAVRAGQASADIVAEGAVLLNNAANNPECSGTDYIDLLVDYAKLGRAGAQTLQAERILKTLSPEGKLYAVQKIVDSMNAEVEAKESASPKKAEKKAQQEQKKNKERSEKTEKAVKQAKEKVARTIFTFEYSDEAAQMIAKAVEARANARTQRNKTMMEELVDTIKKFAVERIPRQSANARRMTATDLLTELSNNEEFAREAYELAQHQVRQDTRGTPSAAVASQFSDSGLDLDNSNIVKRAVAESAVSTNENRNTILNQSALGIGENEIANSIAEDLIEKTGASEDIANSIREAALDYVQEVLGSETFESAEEADAAADERVQTLVNRAMSQIGEQFRNLAVSDEYTRQAALQAVRDTLTEQYGVNGRSATRIAESIVERFDAQLSEAIQEELENRFGAKDAATAVERQLPDRLAEAINLGAFTSEYAEQAINDVFGVNGRYSLDPALVEEYRQQTTDEGRDAVLEKIQKAIADQVPSTLMDKFTAIRYQNMLGNLKTQVRNVLGNTGMMLVQKAKNTMRSFVETGASIATGGKYQKTYSTTAILNPKLTHASFMDFYNNKDIRDLTLGERKWSSPRQQYSSEIQKNVNPWKYGDNKLTRALNIAGKQGPIFKLLELYNRATGWAMENGDKIFTALNYTDALAGYMKAHKITSAQWNSLVEEANADPNSQAAQTVDAARQFAIQQAQEATFRDSNAISEFAQNFDKNWKAAGIITQGIAPFRKTPANVAVRMEEYSPLGLANTVVKAIQAAKGINNVTGADVIDSLSKTMTGVGLSYLGWCLAAAGQARTKSDDDKQEAFDKLRGLQDYSITIGGKNYTLDWAVPAAAALFMGVEGFNLMMDGVVTGDDMLRIMGNLTSPMLQMSMLSGLNDALNNISAFNDDTDALPQFTLNSAWNFLMQGFTNTLAGQLEQANEDYRQTYYTDPDSWIPTSLQKGLAKAGNKTPGRDFNAADYIDAWGRKQKNADSKLERYFNALINPSYTSDLDEKTTKVDAELQRLYDYGKDKEDFPNVIPQQTKRNTTVNGKRLTPEEYDRYATKKGQESLDLVTSLINSKEYQNLTDDGKAKAISECYSYAKYLADEDISKSRKEESTNDSYYNLMTGVDKSGTQYDKTALNSSNFVAYTAFKIGLDEAVKNGDYETIDKYVVAYGKQNNNLKTVLGERNSTVRALSAWKDAGLDSKTYYDVQKELVKSQQKLDKSQKTGSAVELDALANVNLPEATKKRLIDSLPDYGSKTVKGVYDILYSYGFNSKQINDFWNQSQDWVYKDSGEAQSSQKAGTLQPLEAAYAIQQLPGLTQQQQSDIYNKLKEVAHNPYKINDWGNWTFASEKNYLDSGRSYQEFGGKTSGATFDVQPPKASESYNSLLRALGIG